MSDNVIEFSIEADASEAKKGFDDADRAAGKLEGTQKDVAKSSDEVTKSTKKEGDAHDATSKKVADHDKKASDLEKTLGLVKKAMAALAAVASVDMAFSLAKVAAQNEQIATSFDSSFAMAGIATEGLLDQINDLTKNTVDGEDIMTLSTQALASGFVKSGDELTQMWELARLKGKQMGMDTTTAFDMLTTAIGNQTPKMLKAVGISLNLDQVYKDFAKTQRKKVEDLTDEEKRTAVLNATLAANQAALEDSSFAQLSAAERFKQLGVRIDDVKDSIGAWLLPKFMELFEYVDKNVIPVVTELARQAAEWLTPKIVELSGKVGNLWEKMQPLWGTIVNDVLPAIAGLVTFGIDVLFTAIGGIIDTTAQIIGFFNQNEDAANLLKDVLLGVGAAFLAIKAYAIAQGMWTALAGGITMVTTAVAGAGGLSAALALLPTMAAPIVLGISAVLVADAIKKVAELQGNLDALNGAADNLREQVAMIDERIATARANGDTEKARNLVVLKAQTEQSAAEAEAAANPGGLAGMFRNMFGGNWQGGELGSAGVSAFPSMAGGGMISPYGQKPVPIMGHEGEYLLNPRIPEQRAVLERGFGGGGQTVNVVFNNAVVRTESDIRDIVDKVAKVLGRQRELSLLGSQ